MKKLFTLILSVLAFCLLSVNLFAQDVAGKWEGTLNYKQFNGAFDAVSYDWDFEKWNTVFTIYQ
ncbi:MAG TPA: hypothetical protein PKY82_33400, partial [Pyrinomonadaceae bacterium]|nr:hypothetical protein [Pyrinomonadaceae bacterium]